MSAEIRTGRLGTHTLASIHLPGMHRTGADSREGLTITYRLESPGYPTARLTAPVFRRQEDMSLARVQGMVGVGTEGPQGSR